MSNIVADALKAFFHEAKYPIIFTGAGVSVRAKLPTWKQVIEQLAEGIRSSDSLTTQQMYQCIKDGNYTLAVDYFNMSPQMLLGDKQELLRNIFSNYDVTPILSVAKLPFRGCLTTNFDRSIINAYAKVHGLAPIDYKYGDKSFRQTQWEENCFVARIHGSVEAPESIVLSETQFKTLLEDETYADLLRTCFTQRNVLFLGFSFYDPAIRHVFEELDKRFGAASSGRHLALLPSDAGSDFTRKASRLNIKIVQYDSADQHAELWSGIEEFNKNIKDTAPPISNKGTPFEAAKNYLAACYARAKSLGKTVALREAVLEGMVSAMLQEAAPRAISRNDLLEKLRLLLGLKGREFEIVLDGAIKSMIEAGLCRKLKAEGGRGYKLAWIGKTEDADSLNSAIGVLVDSVRDRAYLQEGWKIGREVNDTMTTFFKQLVVRRGWDLGAAFAARRPPESVAIESLLNQCAVGLTAFDMERLGRICRVMLQNPSEEESVVLNELGHISFAMEMAFQSPKSVLLHKAVLPKVIYFDASVLLPALVKGHPFSKIYSEAISRLKSAASTAAIQLKIKVCSVYLNEIISHRNNAESYSAQFGKDFPTAAQRDALFHGSTNLNVYIGAYANWIESHDHITFKEFLSRVAPYTTEQQLKRWLTSQGFEVFDTYKGSKYSEFYGVLERGYANLLAYGKDPILIEHDATQLSILDSDLRKGERSVFVTADRRLQSIAAESKFSFASDMMISHVGLIQFIELLLGGMSDGAGMTELLWNARVSDRAQAVRAYFTSLGLRQYDEGLAMTMSEVIEQSSETATQELERLDADLDSEDPKKRASAFRVLGTLEKNYLASMRESVEKLKASLKKR